VDCVSNDPTPDGMELFWYPIEAVFTMLVIVVAFATHRISYATRRWRPRQFGFNHHGLAEDPAAGPASPSTGEGRGRGCPCSRCGLAGP
jgi:hypothetical protein